MTHVQKTVTIRASQDTVFAEWMERFPDLLADDTRPEWLDDRHVRWVGEGDGESARVARLTRVTPNEQIEWESDDDGEHGTAEASNDAPRQSGILSLTPTTEFGTEVWLSIDCEPADGGLEGRVDKALGAFRERVEVGLRGDQRVDAGSQVNEPWRGVGRRTQTEYGSD